MTRLEGNPANVVANADGSLFALVRGTVLSLCAPASSEPLETLVSVELPPALSYDIGFVSAPQRLLVIAAQEETTQMIGYAVPDLVRITAQTIDKSWRALAYVSDRCLLSCTSEPKFLLAILTPRAISIEAILVRPPVRFASAGIEHCLLIDARTSLEQWTALGREITHRLTTVLPADVVQAGYAHGNRLLWVASRSGRIDVSRCSDGRPQGPFELGAELIALDGRPESPRLLGLRQDKDSGAQSLTLLDLVSQQHHVVQVEQPIVAFCLLESTPPAAATVDERGALLLLLLPELKRSAALGVPVPIRAAGGGIWTPPLRSAAPPTPSEAVVRSGAARTGNQAVSSGSTADAAVVPLAYGSAGASDRVSPSPLPVTSSSIGRVAPVRAATTTAAVDDTGDGWREPLVAWAELCFRESAARPLPEQPLHSTLRWVIDRLELDPLAVRILALLYASWLLGEDGVAVARLARVVAERGAWRECLGRGELARLGLVARRRGRLRLEPLVGRLLDGLPARFGIFDVGPAVAAAPGRTLEHAHRMTVTSDVRAEVLGRQLVRLLGRRVVLCELRTQPLHKWVPRCEAALAEARLYDAIALVVLGEVPPFAELPDDVLAQPLVVALADPVPAALAGLPLLDFG